MNNGRKRQETAEVTSVIKSLCSSRYTVLVMHPTAFYLFIYLLYRDEQARHE